MTIVLRRIGSDRARVWDTRRPFSLDAKGKRTLVLRAGGVWLREGRGAKARQKLLFSTLDESPRRCAQLPGLTLARAKSSRIGLSREISDDGQLFALRSAAGGVAFEARSVNDYFECRHDGLVVRRQLDSFRLEARLRTLLLDGPKGQTALRKGRAVELSLGELMKTRVDGGRIGWSFGIAAREEGTAVFTAPSATESELGRWILSTMLSLPVLAVLAWQLALFQAAPSRPETVTITGPMAVETLPQELIPLSPVTGEAPSVIAPVPVAPPLTEAVSTKQEPLPAERSPIAAPVNHPPKALPLAAQPEQKRERQEKRSQKILKKETALLDDALRAFDEAPPVRPTSAPKSVAHIAKRGPAPAELMPAPAPLSAPSLEQAIANRVAVAPTAPEVRVAGATSRAGSRAETMDYRAVTTRAQTEVAGQGSSFVGVKASESTVEGELAKESVAAVVRDHLGEIRRCYEGSLRQRSRFQGKVTARFSVGPQGATQNISLETDGKLATELSHCLKQRIANWLFPAPNGGRLVKVSYPFLFSFLGSSTSSEE